MFAASFVMDSLVSKVAVEGQKIRYLFGATTQPEVISFVRTQCMVRDDAELQGIVQDWKLAAQKFSAITSFPKVVPETMSVIDLPRDVEPVIRKISAEPSFQKSFSMLPMSFGMVEIDKLVAGQRYVNLDYVAKLLKSLPSDPNLVDLIEFCFAKTPDVAPPAELQLGPNVYSYRSDTTDFRFLGGFPKPLSKEDLEAAVAGGLPVAGIILLVGYGSSAINAFRVGQRYVLNNGFHRLFALRKHGIKTAPMVIQHITNPDLELPPQLVGLPTQYMTEHPRPSMMMDFFDDSLVIELRMKARDRSVQIQWNINQIDIPK
jgi:hypothetical protein